MHFNEPAYEGKTNSQAAFRAALMHAHLGKEIEHVRKERRQP